MCNGVWLDMADVEGFVSALFGIRETTRGYMLVFDEGFNDYAWALKLSKGIYDRFGKDELMRYLRPDLTRIRMRRFQDAELRGESLKAYDLAVASCVELSGRFDVYEYPEEIERCYNGRLENPQRGNVPD